MNELLKQKCDLLISNQNVFHDTFMWDPTLLAIIGSIAYVGSQKVADPQKLKECNEIIKKHEGIFSYFRGNSKIPVISKMSLSEDPEKYLLTLKDVYEKLHKNKICGSDYMVMTAIAICELNNAANIDSIIDKTKLILKEMNKIHPILTGDEDMSLVALLAMSDMSIEKIIEETEYFYSAMKSKFTFSNEAVQSLSHIMTLMEGDADSKIQKVFALYDSLKDQGTKYGKSHILSALGAIISAEEQPEILAKDILEVSDYLKKFNGYGTFGIGKDAKLMVATLLVADLYSNDNNAMNVAFINNSLSIIIAQQMAIFVCISAIVSSSASN